MPVEVRELIIKAAVVQDRPEEQKSPETTSNNSVTPSQELVAAVIEKMIDLQKDKNER